MAELSVLIAARTEMFLRDTVEDVLAHAHGDTEIIVVLDGAPADPPLREHPRVRVLALDQSIGQRAAVNLAAKHSTARYVMKLDAHCAVAEGFDVALMADCDEDWTVIPQMRNLHVFNRRCRSCGHELYQGPMARVSCEKCQSVAGFDRVMVWKPRNGTRTECWRFDHELHFQYIDRKKPKFDYTKRPEFAGDIVDAMTSIGACFFMPRARFWALGGLDERTGSWGQFGVEVALKSVLSGGRHVMTRKTWFAHMFRTQGQGFGFPYPITGSQQDAARKYSRDMWLNNKWPGQIHPLSWWVERFAPVQDWHEPHGAKALAAIHAAGVSFRVVKPLADFARSHELPADSDQSPGRQKVSANAMGLPSVDARRGIGGEEVLRVGSHTEMGRIAAGAVSTDVVNDGNMLSAPARDGMNQPSEHDAVCQPSDRTTDSALPIATSDDGRSPFPASGVFTDGYSGKEVADLRARENGNREKIGVSHASALRADVRSGAASCDQHDSAPSSLTHPRKGFIYYSDGKPEPRILEAVRANLARVAGHLPSVSVSLAPLEPLGPHDQVIVRQDWTRGYLTMFRQILLALETLDADAVFFCEHDILYHASHFAFTPARRDVFTYNQHTWKVDADTGQALHYRCSQVSGLCADRALLLAHYRARVAHVEAHGFDRNLGFEPGTNRRSRELDPHGAETWWSIGPNIDIRHGANLTRSRWSQDQFRDKTTCEGWTLADEVPGWGRTKGRFAEFLDGIGQRERAA